MALLPLISGTPSSNALVVGITTILGGVSGQVLFDDGGVLGTTTTTTTSSSGSTLASLTALAAVTGMSTNDIRYAIDTDDETYVYRFVSGAGTSDFPLRVRAGDDSGYWQRFL